MNTYLYGISFSFQPPAALQCNRQQVFSLNMRLFVLYCDMSFECSITLKCNILHITLSFSLSLAVRKRLPEGSDPHRPFFPAPRRRQSEANMVAAEVAVATIREVFEREPAAFDRVALVCFDSAATEAFGSALA